MKKFKQVLLSILSLVLVAVLSIGGTIAYLTSEDSDVNVMTMGNVKIEQLEYERVVDENGNWVPTGETDKYGFTPDKLQEFTQSKPLYPAVFTDGNIKWDDRDTANGKDHQQSWGQVGASGSLQLFDDSVKNVQDKMVFVKNTGKSDAYVRTWIAFEQGNLTSENFSSIINVNADASQTGVNEAGGNSHWIYEVYGTDVEIDGNKYVVYKYTYVGAKNNNGILAPGAVSYPSLTQVYMKPEATNEEVEAIDGNGNGTYDILVLSQAVQTKGFTDAETALDTAFGEGQPWVNGVTIAVTVKTEEEFNEAARAGKDMIIGKNIEFKEGSTVIAKDLTIYLNGKTLTTQRPLFAGASTKDVSTITIDGANVVIKGEGKVLNVGTDSVYAIGIINNGKVTIDGGYYEAFHDTFYVKKGTLEIKSGRFNTIGDNEPYAVEDKSPHSGTFEDCFSNSVINCDDDQYTTGNAIVKVTGGSFRNFNPSNVHEGRLHHQNHVQAGYKVEASTQDANGDVWYTVVAE